jgi:chromosome segregation ATPase|tara:strand:- start:244 stop:492 length:249 start_codon:yes stop_codon:yes gene_type:complete
MDNNFEALEQEVNRLVEALSQLRDENDQLKKDLSQSISLQEKIQDDLKICQQHEQELKTVQNNHEAVRNKIEVLLNRLNKIE